MGRGKNATYLQAQCLQSMKEYQHADKLLNEYLTAVANETAYDDYLFPNALYLKGAHCMRFRDLDGAQSYFRQGAAAELNRCLFYGEVDSAAKRSLSRVFRVAFGDDSERRAALMEFTAAFQSKLSTQDEQSTV